MQRIQVDIDITSRCSDQSNGNIPNMHPQCVECCGAGSRDDAKPPLLKLLEGSVNH